MTDYAQGASAGLVADFVEFVGGPALDVDTNSLSITVTNLTTGAIAVGPTSTGIVHVATGVYSYVWAIPQSQAVGDYLVHWAATIASVPVTADETITIVDLAVEAWATASDVLAITGQAVSGPQLAVAQGVVELHVGRTTDAVMTVRDLSWLKRAVSWQAAWLVGQYGFLFRSTVTNVSQDGVSTSFPDLSAITLGPLCRRAINNLSWTGTRSLRIRPRRRDDYAYELSYADAGDPQGGANFTSETSDDAALWTPYEMEVRA